MSVTVPDVRAIADRLQEIRVRQSELARAREYVARGVLAPRVLEQVVPPGLRGVVDVSPTGVRLAAQRRAYDRCQAGELSLEEVSALVDAEMALLAEEGRAVYAGRPRFPAPASSELIAAVAEAVQTNGNPVEATLLLLALPAEAHARLPRNMTWHSTWSRFPADIEPEVMAVLESIRAAELRTHAAAGLPEGHAQMSDRELLEADLQRQIGGRRNVAAVGKSALVQDAAAAQGIPVHDLPMASGDEGDLAGPVTVRPAPPKGPRR
jgi:hypothetical protein